MAATRGREPEQPSARRNRTEPVARGTAPLTADIFARAGFRDPTLVLRWREIAGAQVAQVCQPVKLSEGPNGGVLTLKTEPGAAVFLHHESRALCERINTFLGRPAIGRLRFVEGPLPRRPGPRPRRPMPDSVPAADPALGFAGPEPVHQALLKLARRRALRPHPD
ncbi:MAG TPA: DUF721 domain-containing protein [Rhizomicrobium sp.]|nr:DUF721 domain-containing protein [Rhizomicrobium sp.]